MTILKEALDHDDLIDIPIFKHYCGARISGSLKNLTGFNWKSISSHQGEDYLHQAIDNLTIDCFKNGTRTMAALFYQLAR